MTDPLPPFDPKAAAGFFTRHGHSGWLGLRYRDHGADWVELELPWRADLVGEDDRAIIASGPIVSLLDMASGMAIWTARGGFQPMATLDLRVDYQRPARPGSSVVGRAQCYRLTRSAAFVRGFAHDGDDGDRVASMAGVFMVIGNDARQGDA